MSSIDLQDDIHKSFQPSLLLILRFKHKVCDLSGRVPFRVVVEISRRPRPDSVKHQTPILVQKKGTYLYVPSALETGLLLIIPDSSHEESEEKAKPIQILPGFSKSIKTNDNFIRIEPGTSISIQSPQLLEYTLDISKLVGLQDGVFYRLEHGPAKPADNSYWHCGMSWWKFSPHEEDVVDLLTPGEPGQIKARCNIGSGPFKAKTNVDVPPHFDYSLCVNSTTIDLARPESFTVSVKFVMRTPPTATIHTKRTRDHPILTILHKNLALTCFDIVDADTGQVLSDQHPRSIAQLDPKVLGKPYIERSHLREFIADQNYENTVTCLPTELETELHRGLRIKDFNVLVGRNLCLKIRPTETWWSSKSLDDLFGDHEKIKKDIYTAPLLIESDVCVPLKIVI